MIKIGNHLNGCLIALHSKYSLLHEKMETYFHSSISPRYINMKKMFFTITNWDFKSKKK